MSSSLPSSAAHRISRGAVLLSIVCGALVPLAARGADDGTDASITLVKELQEFVVQEGGSYVLTQQTARQVNEQVFALTTETARTQPFVCPENDFDEEADDEYPAGATLLAVPPDVHVASPYFRYDARFARVQGQLHITRRFKSGKAGTRVCTPQDHAAMQADIRRMVRDLRSQFILQVPDAALTAHQTNVD